MAVIACEARAYARSLGLEAWLSYSKTPGSASRYLLVRLPDRDEPWVLRISDHPNRHGVAADCEVISLDGRTGAAEARAFIDAAFTAAK